MKNTSAKKTVEERRKDLEHEMMKLDAIENVVDWLNSEIEGCKITIENLTQTTVEIGREEEQATNLDGELLWLTDDYNYCGHTEEWLRKRLNEEGLKTMTPYYKPITETRKLSDDQMDDWTRRRIIEQNMIIELLETAKDSL